MSKSLALSAALVLSLAACTTAPVSPDKTTAAKVQTPAGCVGQSATLLPVKPGTCAAFGSTYTRDDIDKTGQVDLARALQMLDPSISRP